jgi:hypothetical protein
MSRAPRVSDAMRIPLVVLALMLVACGTTSTPSPTAVEPIAFAEEGPFRLELELPKTTYAPGEPVEGIARLRFAGPGSIEIAGSGSALIVTALVDADGMVLTGAATADCAQYTIDPATPFTTGLVKSGGYLPDDPSDDFVEAFLKDPVFRLPVGKWGIQASSEFLGQGCTPPSVKLSATVPIIVSD